MPKFLRWVLVLAGIIAGTVGLSMLIGGIAAHAASAPDTESTGGIIVAAIGAALFVVGWLLGMFSFPVFTAFAGLAVAFVLALGAIVSAVFAYVVSRTSPPHFDPDRAALDGWNGAGICLVAALCLALNWMIWQRRRGSGRAIHHVLHVIAIGYGSLHVSIGIGLAGACIAGMVQTRGLEGPSSHHLEQAVGYAGLAALYIGSGAVLVWHGAAALTGVGSSRFRPPPLWLPLGAMVVATAIGGLLIQADFAVGFMPPAQAVAVVMPGLALLAFVAVAGDRARAAGRSSWRELLLMAAYGAVGAATIAALINTVVIAGSLFVALTAHGVFDGIGTTQEFQEAVNNASDILGERGLIVPLLVSIALIGPLNEEFWKGFGVRLLRGHDPTRYRAFIWGVASGVGFGSAEVTQYGLAAFHRSPYRWWDVVLVRGAASSMHALASGVVGIGWYYVFAGRRLRGLGLYLVAAGLHGSWNGLNVLTSARVLPPFEGLSDHDLEIVLELVTIPLAIAIVYTLGRLARLLAEEDDADSTRPSLPLPSRPVLGERAILGEPSHTG